MTFIEASKKDDEIQIASANAITILTQAERAKLYNINFKNAEL
ncbi:12570_t:CDS:2 [Gigaspora rosea]|nr:12570_t:CDS:2 [Gigaspora rosea]